MAKSTTFTILSLSCLAGIWFGSAHQILELYLWIFSALMVMVLAWCFASAKKLIVVPLLVIVFILGVWRIRLTFVNSEYKQDYSQTVEFEGYVIADLDRRLDKQLITIQPTDKTQRILATTSLYGQYSYGDWVWVRGKIAEPREFDGFDYRKYLERYNVYALMYYPKIIVLKQEQGHAVMQELLQVKQMFVARLSKVFQEPRLSLLLGLLIGARKTLPQPIVDAFLVTGLSHIVAVSGYNTSVIIKTLEKTARLLGRRNSLFLSAICIVGFVIISGASSSVIRASIMGTLLLFSFASGRLYAITPALCAAALVMALVNPRIVYWDIGFQLSFLATAGIVYIFPVFEKFTENVPDFLSLKTYLLTSLAAIIATLPLVVLQFERISLIAPLANLLVLPVIPMTMLFGFLSALPVVGSGFAFLGDWLLRYILSMTFQLSELPLASTDMAISAFSFVLSYVIICLALFLWRWHLNIQNQALDSSP